jgi:23S rRNA pseudouridine1911/1915/1917 synthase
MVLNKPSGVVVSLTSDLDGNRLINTSTRVSDPASQSVRAQELQKILEREFQFPIIKDESRANGILHRLDRDTTGALLVARSYSGFYDLRFQFAANQIVKEYTCLVNGNFPRLGVWNSIERRIQTEKARDTDGHVKLQSRVVDEGGEHAFTEYMPKATYVVKGTKHPVSLLNVRLHTGRSHQIRVHLSSIGHPLLYDWNYGDKQNPTAKFFLHARSLEFWNPDSPSDRIRIDVKMPIRMHEFIQNQLDIIDSIE